MFQYFNRDEFMLGAIVGDIVGSVYEWHNIKTKERRHLPRRGQRHAGCDYRKHSGGCLRHSRLDKDKAYSYLDKPLKDVLRRWRKFISKD